MDKVLKVVVEVGMDFGRQTAVSLVGRLRVHVAPFDRSVTSEAQVNEGKVGTKRGRW